VIVEMLCSYKHDEQYNLQAGSFPALPTNLAVWLVLNGLARDPTGNYETGERVTGSVQLKPEDVRTWVK
jgi:hypothetical protein